MRVPEGKILRPGMKDTRVIALRKRLNIAGDKDNPLYDEAVAEAVKTSRPSRISTPTAMLGPNTVRALNGAEARGSAHRRQSGRHHPRQHGALALAAAQPGQHDTYVDGQRARTIR